MAHIIMCSYPDQTLLTPLLRLSVWTTHVHGLAEVLAVDKPYTLAG